MKHYFYNVVPLLDELVLWQHQSLDLDKEVPHQFFSGCVNGSVLDSGIPGPRHNRTLQPGLQHFILPLYNHTGTSLVSLVVIVCT